MKTLQPKSAWNLRARGIRWPMLPGSQHCPRSKGAVGSGCGRKIRVDIPALAWKITIVGRDFAYCQVSTGSSRPDSQFPRRKNHIAGQKAREASRTKMRKTYLKSIILPHLLNPFPQSFLPHLLPLTSTQTHHLFPRFHISSSWDHICFNR
jgi:hypothetical protein